MAGLLITPTTPMNRRKAPQERSRVRCKIASPLGVLLNKTAEFSDFWKAPRPPRAACACRSHTSGGWRKLRNRDCYVRNGNDECLPRGWQPGRLACQSQSPAPVLRSARCGNRDYEIDRAPPPYTTGSGYKYSEAWAGHYVASLPTTRESFPVVGSSLHVP